MANDTVIKITGDASGFEHSVAKAKAAVVSLGTTAKTASSIFSSALGMMTRATSILGVALSAGAIVSGLKKIADHIDNVAKTSSRIGMTTEALSELQYAARMNGSSSDAMSAALQTLSKNLGLAASGSGTAKAAFEAMGIKITDANGKVKSTEEIFREIADKFSGYADGAEKSALANAIFGRSGVELINVLNLGKSGLNDMATEARKFGQVVDKEAAKAASDFNDNLDRLASTAKAAGQSILGGLLPSLNQIIERFLTALQASKNFWGFLQNFRALGNSDFAAPAKAIEGYKTSIASLEDELKKLKKQQEGLSGEEWEELESQIQDVEDAIKRANRATELLQPLADKAKKQEAAKTKTGSQQGTTADSKTAAPKLPSSDKSNSEVAIEQAKNKALAKIADAKAKRDASLIEDRIERERFAAEQMVEIGLMSRDQLLAQEKAYESQSYEEQKKALEQKLALFKNDNDNPEVQAKYKVQLLDLEKKHNKKILELDKQQAKERQKYVKQFYDSMQSGFANVLTQFMNGELTIRGLFKGLFDAVLQAFVGVIAQIAAKWLAQQVMMLATGKATASSNILAAAAKAGAEGTASFAGAPWPVNIGAPAFGASMYAAAAAYEAGLASAAGGYDIPAGVNPLTQLHEKEMVLPASIAEPLRNSLASKQSSATTVVNLHGVSAGRFFVAAKKDLVKALKGANRDFAFAS